MFVLGIDPGLSRCGYGLVKKETSSGSAGALRGAPAVAVSGGVIVTDTHLDIPRRLSQLMGELQSLITESHPDVVVVERIFFQANARTAVGIGQAGGLALALADAAGCQVVQYSANEVKLAVTGYGGATKLQVQRMVASLLGLNGLPSPPDVADALGLALCYLVNLPMQAALSVALRGNRAIGQAAPMEVGR
ncbi:MAG: crossover junction endodeoxyribonuclease RuvC [Acidimicrobiales bacterium]